MKKIVGVADMKVSNDPNDSIIAYSLGSCIGLVVYDPQAKVGGVVHCMLPDSSIDKSKAKINPFMFADTAVPELFKTIDSFGANKTRINIYLAGGAEILDQNGFFNIGKQNYLAMKKMFVQENLSIIKQNVGGNVNRTIRLDMSTGDIYIKTPGSSEEKI